MRGHQESKGLGQDVPLVFGRDYSWQERCEQSFISNIGDYYSVNPGEFKHAFVMEVTPSGGKTVGSLKIARHLIDENLADYIIWLSPRESIKQGIEDDCKIVELRNRGKWIWNQPHIRVDTTMRNDFNRVPENHHGVIINYQSLETMLGYFTMLRAHKRLAFVFDEAHHGAYDEDTGAGNVWGEAMRKCAGLSHCVICMTGTPVRPDNDKVPYFLYKQIAVDTMRGVAAGYEIIPDFRFSYADGIAAGPVKKISRPSVNLHYRHRLLV